MESFIRKNNASPSAFTIIIGGTNGKGSAAALMEAVLLSAGVDTGLFSSPHVYEYSERLTFNGVPIGEDAFREILGFVKRHFEKEGESPTFYDVLTCAALVYFTRYRPPRALILEVGIGGRLDPVNGARRDLCLITNVGHDHSHILGSYPLGIAREKAGIISPGVPLVTSEKNPAALQVFQDICRQKGSPLHHAGPVSSPAPGPWGTSFTLNGKTLRSNIPGLCQGDNCALVIKAVEESAGKAFAIGYDSIQKGLAQARIPWRMEVAGRDPFVILDGAHNRESWENLRQTLANFPFQNLHAIVAIQKLKTPEDFPKNLPGKEVFLHLPRIPGPAFHSPQHLTQALSGFQGKIILHPDTPSALSHITPILQKDDLLLVTGTFKLAPYLRSRQSFHIPDLSCGS